MAADGPDLAGAVLLRRYRLVERLGEGAMGTVYRAEDTAHQGGGEFRAIKLLRPEYVRNAHIGQRFLEEARTGQRIQHPNVVRVHDVQTAEDGTPFFVMDLCEGAPIASYVQGGKRIALDGAASILGGVLAGLDAAHAVGVVHRDLKPENVILVSDPRLGGVVPKILDFGIAKVMDAAGGMGSRTATGMLLGTPAYMSPEQIRNSKDVDPRSDLFSAGVLFYEMITGRAAFTAPNEFAKLTAVLTTEPEPIERVDPALGHVGPFLRRALAKDRAARFQSAAEMSAALSRLAAPPRTLSGFPAALAPTVPVVQSPQAAAPAPEKSGTLASEPSGPVQDLVPNVSIAPPPPTWMVRMLPAWVAAILVLLALLFGFLLGLGVAESL